MNGVRHRALSALVLLAAAVAAPGEVLAAGSRPEDEKWVVLTVSPSGRVLVVQAIGGGCGHDPFATVAETRDAVRLHVRQLVPDDPNAICPAIARIDIMRVRLSSPIAGRRLERQSLTSATAAPGRRRTMPRVIGLRARDARYALRAQGFRLHGDRTGVVRSQRPRPGTPLPDGRTDATLATGVSS
jgi:hypothetical protein